MRAMRLKQDCWWFCTEVAFYEELVMVSCGDIMQK